MSFHRQFLCLSLQLKKPEKDLAFNNVAVEGDLENCAYVFL